MLVVVVGEHLDGNLDADHAVGLRGAAIDLGDGLRERFALLARQELGELVLPLAQVLRELLHERRTFRERARAPGGKRAARSGDGAVELGAVRSRTAREHGAERRVDDVEMLRALLELAADQQREIRS